jgi:predicted small lipoprotein YifL
VRSLILTTVVAALACGPKGPVESAPAPPSTPPAERAAQVVNATILVNGCQDFGRANAKLAEKAMYELVEGCSSVPSGIAQFGATLLPSGRIEITTAPGQPDLIPICILKHPLVHKVPLSRPCRLDVKIEQTSVPVHADAGS